jgi:glycerol-3-phosphate acyltransferase PlsY
MEAGSPIFPLDIRVDDIPLLASAGLLLLGYVLGSFPGSLLVGRLVGIDPAAEGERHPGAANVWKLAGPGPGMAALLLDLGRAVLPALAGLWLAGWWGAWTAGIGAVLGSMRPIWPAWRGGRGVAAGIGVALVLNPPAFAAALGTGAGTYLVMRRRARAIAIGIATFPIAFVLLSVRTPDELLALGGVGLLYLVLVAGFWLTRRRATAT